MSEADSITIKMADLGAAKLTDTVPTGIRWVIRHGWDGPERVLQYALCWTQGDSFGVDWVDVPIVDLTKEHHEHD